MTLACNVDSADIGRSIYGPGQALITCSVVYQVFGIQLATIKELTNSNIEVSPDV